MNIPSWKFASTQGGREDAISNPLIETFEGDYNYFLAREILQNAIDAKNPNKEGPVKVVFSLENFTKDLIPGYTELKEIINRAEEYWPKEDLKCHKFLESAVSVLSKHKIPVLKISDFNTTGLTGQDSDLTSSWYGLVRSLGSTTKREGQGGSYGLGKGAAFAASFLRTVFYSTMNEKEDPIFQGVAELVSYKDSTGDVKRGTGSYSLNKQASIREEGQIPGHMIRKEQGLDTFIIGYKVEKNWQNKLIKSILRNFWPAIHEKILIVNVDGNEINSKNLESKLIDKFLDKPNKDNVKPEGNPLQFYKAYKNGSVYSNSLPKLGKVEFYFSNLESKLNRVAMIRKSKMVIYTQDFRWHSPYVGVFICENEKGNRNLRSMESPRHDIWDKELNKKEGEAIDEELRGFIRGFLKSLSNIKNSGSVEVPELYKYLPYDSGSVPLTSNNLGNSDYLEEESEIETALEINLEDSIAENILISPEKISVTNEPSKGFGGEGIIVPKGDRKRKKKRRQGGGKGEEDSILSKETKVRIFLNQIIKGSVIYQVVIRSRINGKCNARIFAVGEEGTQKIEIVSVEDLNGNRYFSSGNRITGVHLDSERGLNLLVSVKSNFKMSMKIVLYDLQQ